MKNKLSKLTPSEVAYLAGFFDGEGCISIAETSNKNSINPYFSLRIGITQCDLEFLKSMADLTGIGRVYTTRSRKKEWRDSATWWITGLDAIKFIKCIYPHLIIKKEQAEVALEFWSVRCEPHQGRGYRVSSKLNEKRTYYKNLLSTLKHKPAFGEDYELPEPPESKAEQLCLLVGVAPLVENLAP